MEELQLAFLMPVNRCVSAVFGVQNTRAARGKPQYNLFFQNQTTMLKLTFLVVKNNQAV